MPDGMVVAATTIYFGTAVLLAVVGIAFVSLALRESGDTRKLVFVGAVPALSMATAYVFMGMEWVTVTTAGREQSIARFVGYSLVLAAAAYAVSELIRLSARQFLGLTGVLLLTPWFALASWLPDGGALESALTAATLGSYLVGVYVLFGPVTRHAAGVSGERRLTFAKLRNLFVLCWGALIIQSAISAQALGLTNLFVGQIGASYTDLVFVIGIGGLIVSARAVFENNVGRAAKTEENAGVKQPTGGDD